MNKILSQIARFPYTPALLLMALGFLSVLIFQDAPQFAFNLSQIGIGSAEGGMNADQWPAGWLLVLIGLVIYVIQFWDLRRSRAHYDRVDFPQAEAQVRSRGFGSPAGGPDLPKLFLELDQMQKSILWLLFGFAVVTLVLFTALIF